ncbi:Glutathione hydrolase 1 proenzyme [Holothuria leucospilota]|uniref:Glutathione hydrolase 1 proenzyme n=1 Tax=Holothuria leucospilota TaxID=206669 RepID=A0A9Q1CHL2_HOLLE|nr:Glutathione hydrolase 1 proenzyme [Holothuria leucospilota]
MAEVSGQTDVEIVDSISKERKNTRVKIAAAVVIALIVVGLIIAVIFIISNFEEELPRSPKHYKNAVVAADAEECSIIGRDILQIGGSAADAMVASLLCTGLFSGHSSGIGGGAFIVYYDRETKKRVFFNGREVAPLAASKNMYENDTSASRKGGLAIGVPGEVSAMWELHQAYGKLEWSKLFERTIEYARKGFVVPSALAKAITSREKEIRNDTNLREIFVKENGELYSSGDNMTRPKLADTLQLIADEGKDVFYNGSLKENIVKDIEEYNGIITEEDLELYVVAEKEPLEINLDNWVIYSPPPPGSGAVLYLILNILKGYSLTPDSVSNTEKSALTYHRMIEAFKFAYAKRSALGDEDFIDIKELVDQMISQEYADKLRAKISDNVTYTYEHYEPAFLNGEDSGTAHISIVDADGNACAATSTINVYFGSRVRGSRTGIIFNNDMDDFSQPAAANHYGVPPSQSNFIEPRKRPMSSMTPTICVDGNGKVMQVSGASGGPRITTAVATTIMYTKWLGIDLETAIERRRLHDQLFPTTVFYEPGYSQSIIALLEEKGHNMTIKSDFAVVQGINRLEDNWFEAHSDTRKGGFPAGY